MFGKKSVLGSFYVLGTLSTAFAARTHLEPAPIETEFRAITSEATASRGWQNLRQQMDADSCTMALMHHARKINQSLAQTRARLSALISKTRDQYEWVEKPQLLRSGARDRVDEAIAEITSAQQVLQPVAGRQGSELGTSSIVAKNRCDNQLVIGTNDKQSLLSEADAKIRGALLKVQALFENGYLDMKRLGFEGFSETFLEPLYNAQHQVNQLGTGLSTGVEKPLWGVLGVRNPHQKLASNTLKRLQVKLQREFPLAFEPGEAPANSEKRNQMLAVNERLYQFVQAHPLGYTDAADLWKMKLIRNVQSKLATRASSDFLENMLIDKISN